jgi:sugar lactone lactonase YvrE
MLLAPFAAAQTSEKAAASKPAVETPPAGPSADESAQYAAEIVAKNLDNPCGLAVRQTVAPNAPSELFISESGAGRVVRLFTDKPSEVEPVITGFPVAKFGDKPQYNIGPLGLAFITPRTKLAVGTGGLREGEDVVQVYSWPQDVTATSYDKAEYHVGPIAAGGRSKNGEGNFFGLAKTAENDSENAFFVTSAADKEHGWVLKAGVAANRLGDLQPFIASQQVTGVASPSAVAVNPKQRSHYLVVAQMGHTDDQRDSVVAFYTPASGEPAMVLNTGLYDITGLAYNAQSGDLYATDFAWAKPEAGGVYRLEAIEVEGRQSCRPVKIAPAMRPTALAFTPDGSLYVTAMGARNTVDEPPTGVLLKITPKDAKAKL